MSQPSSDPAVTVGVLKETTPGEQRVAVVPESVPVLARADVRVLVEPGAGAAAWFADGAYERAGAKVASRDEVAGGASVLVGVGVGAPPPELIARLRAGPAPSRLYASSLNQRGPPLIPGSASSPGPPRPSACQSMTWNESLA